MALTDSYQAPTGKNPGILAYGPFKASSDETELQDYRIYVHETDNYDVLDYVAYGGPAFQEGKIVTLFKLPLSPFVKDPSLNYVPLLQQIEAYLDNKSDNSAEVKILQKLKFHRVTCARSQEFKTETKSPSIIH